MRNRTVVWLDDTRDPKNDKWYNYIINNFDDEPIIFWIKSYKEFVEHIELCGLPECIFFDHDLGEEKTGMDCMKYVVNLMQDTCYNPNDLSVFFQSSNPVGKENMLMYYFNYKTFYNKYSWKSPKWLFKCLNSLRNFWFKLKNK